MGTRIRRRRAAVAIGCGLAVGAFAAGVTLGDGEHGQVDPSDASQLSRPKLAGQRVVTGFPGTRPPAEVRRMVREGAVAGVILFAENIPSRAAGRRLIASLQAIPRPPGLGDPLLVMVDQEGGLVKRVSGAPNASAREMGERGPAFSRDQGRRTALNLRNIGVNVDLAPVLDVGRPGGTIAETERAFGSTPAAVVASAIPFAEALQAGGVAATGKHFPGFGSARVNTDFAVQRLAISKAELRRIDEAPYRSYIPAGGDLVMLSTAIYPAFSGRPAAFTRSIATGELRGRLGFDGVSITDALESVAVRAFGGAAKAGLAGARAGVDLLLYVDPGAARAGEQALARALTSHSLSRAGFEQSATRVLHLRHALR
jgi:beta-N-acetylhexosaminidase